MAALAEKILLEAAEKDALYKPTYVEKDLDLAFDLGTLLATDPNPLDAQKLRSESREEYLTELARGNTQLLINKLFELPTERVEDVIVAKLPDGTTRLPREKPPPKPKPATRWSEFARQKGIKRRKKEKLVWDETIKEWRPRYGYKRALVEKQKNWVVEVPDGKDPYVDYVGELKEKKKERVAKNEYQRLRNIARNSKAKGETIALSFDQPALRDQSATPHQLLVAKAVTLAKSSTASHGKFAGTLKEEKNVRVRKAKRKASLLFLLLKKEKASQLKVLDEMARKKPKLDINQAVNHFIHDEEVK
ncbi:unnamed protein product [Ixodes persulcatus]